MSRPQPGGQIKRERKNMYEFKIREKFPCSPAEAFAATTSEFEALVKYVPNVTLMKEELRETLPDGRVRIMLRIHGDGAIPAIARPVINSKMLRWREELICNPADLSIQWKIITDHFTDNVHCGGLTYNREAPGGSEVEVNGKFDITLKRFPGLPDGLVQKAVQHVVPYIGKLVEPNLRSFYTSIKKKMKAESSCAK